MCSLDVSLDSRWILVDGMRYITTFPSSTSCFPQPSTDGNVSRGRSSHRESECGTTQLWRPGGVLFCPSLCHVSVAQITRPVILFNWSLRQVCLLLPLNFTCFIFIAQFICFRSLVFPSLQLGLPAATELGCPWILCIGPSATGDGRRLAAWNLRKTVELVFYSSLSSVTDSLY